VNEEMTVKNVLIVGAGGIGTTVVDLLVPALVRIQLNVKITLIDGDIIEASNLGHQNYQPKDIGRHKVDALAEKWLDFEKDLLKRNLNFIHLTKELKKWRLNQSKIEGIPAFLILYDSVLEEIILQRPRDLESLSSISGIGPQTIRKYGEQILKIVLKDKNSDFRSPKLWDSSQNFEMSKNKNRSFERKIEIISQPVNLRYSNQLEGYDLVVVCVDRPEPRRLVHALDVPWIDLRCSADGWMILSSDSDTALVDQMTPDHEPMSCQVEGALDAGNLEFGFSVAGSFGAQWLVQNLRDRRGPVQSMGSLTYGSFEFPRIQNESMEVKA
jgi:hypothetical protein